jgi:hypothetical protein
MAMSLAREFGAVNNLSTVIVNPGLVVTNLGNHLKLFGESDANLVSMRKS